MRIERSSGAGVADVINGTVANAARLADSNDRQLTQEPPVELRSTEKLEAVREALIRS